MSNAIECLLLGGPADGRRMLVRCHWNVFDQAHIPEEVIAIDTAPELDMRTPPAAPPEPIEFKRYYYQRQPLREADQRFWVYTPSGSRDSILATLIAGYRQGGAA